MIAGPEPAISISRLGKAFGGTRALDEVSLSMMPGEIHALVGENGAGKSTLIKILAGVYMADVGEICIAGHAVDARQGSLPISFVHQDLGLIDDLTIGENLALVAGFPKTAGLISWSKVWTQTEKLYRAMGIAPPNPRSPVGMLGASGKAILGIVRALSSENDILVLDEPTASLPGPDAQRLFDILKRLRASGKSILYVSHRLSELFGLVDRVTVLRNGRHIYSKDIQDVTSASIVNAMLGRDLETHPHTSEKVSREPFFTAENLQVENQGPLSFEVGKGEILGLVGLRGEGHEAIGRAIFGLRPHYSGDLTMGGQLLEAGMSVRARIACGIALLAGDRLNESVISGMSLRENLFPNRKILAESLIRPIKTAQEVAETDRILNALDVRPRQQTSLIDWLSGGNQQKVFVGRWIATKARLYIMEEPTAGVDIGAKTAIHRILRDLADAGASILVISSDFEEIATLCDRALSIRRGQIDAELSGAALTLEGLLTDKTQPDSVH